MLLKRGSVISCRRNWNIIRFEDVQPRRIFLRGTDEGLRDMSCRNRLVFPGSDPPDALRDLFSESEFLAGADE